MQPSLTPPALRQPTVVASSWRSYATVAGGAEPGANSWPLDLLFTISLLQNGTSPPQIRLPFFGLKWDWGPGGHLSLGL